MPRGSETVRVVPAAQGDRLRGTTEPAAPEYDLEGCHVMPRISREIGGGVVGINGFDIYYYGTQPAPHRTASVIVRGETHEITEPRDLIDKGRRKALIITTTGVS